MSNPESDQFLSIGIRDGVEHPNNIGHAIAQKAVDELGLRPTANAVASTGLVESNNPSSWWPGEVEQYIEDVASRLAVAFVATPSGIGDTSFNYIKQLVESGVPTVTVEKGALSSHYEEMIPLFPLFGFTTSVGGGTRMLPLSLEHMSPNVNQVHVVLNGTENFIMDALARGLTFPTAVRGAISAGYAEPGATEPIDVINGEFLGDRSKKEVIYFNRVLARDGEEADLISLEQLDRPALTQDDIDQLQAERHVRRAIFSAYRINGAHIPNHDYVGGIEVKHSGWLLRDGYVDVTESAAFERLLMPDASNGVVMVTGKDDADGVYEIAKGPGAAPGPTASSAIKDARQLLANR